MLKMETRLEISLKFVILVHYVIIPNRNQGELVIG